jgi:uncharacterized protein (DUF305 family)
MLEILRQLIWIQNYEIHVMKNMLLDNIIGVPGDSHKNYITTVSDLTKPNELGLTKTFCDANFFDPQKHKQHLKHMNLNDEMYIQYMIPHHQVAVDMSKVL